MRFSILSGSLFALGICFAAIAVGDYFGWISIDDVLHRDKSPFVEVSKTDIEADVASIVEKPVTFEFKNRSSQTVRVVGLTGC